MQGQVVALSDESDHQTGAGAKISYHNNAVFERPVFHFYSTNLEMVIRNLQ